MKPTNFKQTCKYNKIMTSKEEIDELAEEFLTFHQDGSKVYHVKIREAIAFAYNKCQEDVAKELEMHILLNEHDWSRNPQAQLKDFINSINKD